MICNCCNITMDKKEPFVFVCPECNHVLDLRKKFILFDTNYHPKWLFTVEQHDILRDEIISTILHHPATMVYIRPHPRQDVNVLKNRIEKYDGRVVVTDIPIFVLAETCIPVILGASTVAMDCLRMGSVPIEYLRGESKRYRYFNQDVGFVLPAHTPEELVEGVRRLYGFDLNSCKNEVFLK